MSKKNFNGEKITTCKVRLSYPFLFTPDEQGEEKEKRYKATLLFQKGGADDDECLKKLKQQVLVVARKAFGESTTFKDFKHPFKDGDAADRKNDTYVGCLYITAKSKYRPGVVDQKLKEVADDGTIYGGCYVRATITPFSYTVSGNKGVAFALGNVQKLGDGEPFGAARASAADEFDAVDAVTGPECLDDDEISF